MLLRLQTPRAWEMLRSIEYTDMEVVRLLREGSTLAGEIQKAEIFEAQLKPCLISMEQLEAEPVRHNEFVLSSTLCRLAVLKWMSK